MDDAGRPVLQHRYDRDLEGSEGASLVLLSEWIRPASTVLELGPATGYFTRLLKEQLGCTVDAVELDPAMAERARGHCREMVVGDLEQLDLAQALAGCRYDFIVVADVIEHLRQPARLLEQLPALLGPAGELLFSVPNVAYVGVVVELLCGRFDYRDEGILDRGHLRFFTRASLEQLLEAGGLYPWEWRPVVLPLGESGFPSSLEGFGPDFHARLMAHPDALCGQWLVRARPQRPPVPPLQPAACGPDRFPARVFWSSGEAAFDYGRSAVGWGQIGAGRGLITIALPGAERLRLRLADRPGYLHLFSLAVRGPDGEVLWQWQHRQGLPAGVSAAFGVMLQETPAHLLATLLGTESWIEIGHRFSAEVPLTLEVECSWPLSADYLAARQCWEAEVGRLERLVEQLRARMPTAAGEQVPAALALADHCLGLALEGGDDGLAGRAGEAVARYEEALADPGCPGTVASVIGLCRVGWRLEQDKPAPPAELLERLWRLATACLGRVAERRPEGALAAFPELVQATMIHQAHSPATGREALRLLGQIAFRAFGDQVAAHGADFWIWAARAFAWGGLPLVAEQALGCLAGPGEDAAAVYADLRLLAAGCGCSRGSRCVAQWWIESLAADHVAGWAWCPARPLESMDVGVFRADGRHLGDVRADRFRLDLVAAGKGHGRHAFRLDFREPVVIDAESLVVQVRPCR